MKIKQEVIDILEQCEIKGDQLYLPNIQIERKLYLKVNEAIKCLGGKWDRKAKAHLFSDDIGNAIDNAVLSGEVVDIKKELQYFPTPEPVINQLIELARLESSVDCLLLEPSAGEGAIASRLMQYGEVDCCEIHKDFHGSLKELGCNVVGENFLEYRPEWRYNAIIANPPFTRQQDIDHVNHMIDCCCGRVVSIMSAGVMFRNNHKTVQFRDRIGSLDGRLEMLPEGAFKESGTMVNACVLVVDVN